MEYLHSAFLALGAPFLGGMFSGELSSMFEMVGFARMLWTFSSVSFQPLLAGKMGKNAQAKLHGERMLRQERSGRKAVV